MCSRYFEDIDHAKMYAKSRPVYPPAFFTATIDYCSSRGGKFELAVDVGCGTGHQSTIRLAPHFKKIVGVDVSEAQLKQVPENVPNVQFKQGTAEDMFFMESETADLVMAVCSLHWFDIDKFFVETKRVLKEGGSLAVAVISVLRITLSDSDGDHLLRKFLASLDEFTDERHRLAMDEYESVRLPFNPVDKQHIQCTMKWTVGQLADFLSTLTGWQARIKLNPTCETLDKLREDLLTIFRRVTQEDNPVLEIGFPVALLMCRKSRK